MADGEGDHHSALPICLSKSQENIFNFTCICSPSSQWLEKNIYFILKPLFVLESKYN